MQKAPLPETSQTRLALIAGNDQICDQLANAIGRLSDAQYVQSVEGNSPIGKHVRHILEFYQALFDYMNAPAGAVLSYDRRARNMLLENSRDAALQRIRVFRQSFADFPPQNMMVSLQSIVDPDLPMLVIDSSLDRELFYVMDHSIHHMALIKLIAAELGVAFHHGFGLAQSTKAYEEGKS